LAPKTKKPFEEHTGLRQHLLFRLRMTAVRRKPDTGSNTDVIAVPVAWIAPS
jgi:hypothetical protein